MKFLLNTEHKKKKISPQSFLNVLCILLIGVAFLCVLILPCFFTLPDCSDILSLIL